MKKLMILGMVALVAACSDWDFRGGWKYKVIDDHLRKVKITEATTRSLRDPENPDRHPAVMTIRKGSHDNDGIVIHLVDGGCAADSTVAIRVDYAPIEYFSCGNYGLKVIHLPLTDPLAQRIISSEEVVIEGRGQWVFRTSGLKLHH